MSSLSNIESASLKFKKTIFWSNSKKPVLKIPATLKFSCFGNPPKGVATKADYIKLNVSPSFKFRLNANSVPINTLFVLNLFSFTLGI